MIFGYNFLLISSLSIITALASYNKTALLKFAREQLKSSPVSPNFVQGTRPLLNTVTIEAALRTYRDFHEKGKKINSDYVIIAFSIVSCGSCSDSEVTVVRKTEKILLLTQTISSDFIFNAECSFVGSDHPPLYFRFDGIDTPKNVIKNWVAVVKCSPFEANDFSVMEDNALYGELFPQPEIKYQSSEPDDPYYVPVDGESASLTRVVFSIVFGGGFIFLLIICVRRFHRVDRNQFYVAVGEEIQLN